MTETVNADARDHIQLDTAVSQLDQRTIADTTSQIRKVKIATAHSRERVKCLRITMLEIVDRRTHPVNLRLMVAQRLEDQTLGLRDSRVFA